MEKKKQENKMRRDQLNDEYLELLDKQRLYFKTVKDFKEVHTVVFYCDYGCVCTLDTRAEVFNPGPQGPPVLHDLDVSLLQHT